MILDKSGELGFSISVVAFDHAIRLLMKGSCSGITDPQQVAYLMKPWELKI